MFVLLLDFLLLPWNLSCVNRWFSWKRVIWMFLKIDSWFNFFLEFVKTASQVHRLIELTIFFGAHQKLLVILVKYIEVLSWLEDVGGNSCFMGDHRIAFDLGSFINWPFQVQHLGYFDLLFISAFVVWS